MPTTEESFRGRLKALSIADILAFLGGLNRKGLLSVTSEGPAIGLYLRGPNVIHATSTRESDRLSELLRRWGLITPAQHDGVMRQAAAGVRIGKALVSSGTLTPRGLIDARLRQARLITLSIFEWHDGHFLFREGEEPEGETLVVDLPILDLVVDGIRSVRNLALFRERLPSSEWVFEADVPGEGRPADQHLEPQEEYVLSLVDGTRRLGDIAEISEFPDLETRRILFLLLTLGRLRPRAQIAPDAADERSGRPIGEIVGQFNRMFGRLHQYLTRELGPVSEELLSRSLREMQGTHPVLFSRANLGGDGTLNGTILQDNLCGLSDVRKRETLVQGLNELLYSELLILRRTLGPDHERRMLKSLHGDPAASGLGLGRAG